MAIGSVEEITIPSAIRAIRGSDRKSGDREGTRIRQRVPLCDERVTCIIPSALGSSWSCTEQVPRKVEDPGARRGASLVDGLRVRLHGTNASS